ncbi:hypothetical protein [Wohlfahrtiimonas larvae]|uniref:Uncharacterized protein n=1 Tax=Wohlfahrtiimonas larvae TaxID=1157986 RepID=A0ABP9MJZ4_9GAMM|nr:hypothetical protein [Wohlfahrtiimonas larvae]
MNINEANQTLTTVCAVAQSAQQFFSHFKHGGFGDGMWFPEENRSISDDVYQHSILAGCLLAISTDYLNGYRNTEYLDSYENFKSVLDWQAMPIKAHYQPQLKEAINTYNQLIDCIPLINSAIKTLNTLAPSSHN